MAEKDFQSEIARSIRATGKGLYFKIPDSPESRFGPRDRKFQGLQKPFDCFWALPNVFVAMELKQVKGLSINIGDKGHLRPHQEEALLHLQLLADQSALPIYLPLVAVNFVHRFPAKQAAKTGIEMINEAYLINAKNLVNARVSLGTDTIPKAYLATHGIQLEPKRIDKQTGWDLEQLANDLATRGPK
jgi:hypothetical protein